MNGMNGDAVSCRFQLRKFQKLYNAEVAGVESLDPLDLWLDGLVGVLSLLFCSFLEVQASSYYPNPAKYPNGNQCSNQRHLTRNRNTSITQCVARKGINTGKYCLVITTNP